MRLGSTLICRFVRSTSSHHRHWHIALAVTAGVLLGILPKSSLLIPLVGLICFVIPAHLPLLALTAILISFATPLLESTMGRIGLWSLTHPQLSAYWMRLESLPLAPWLSIQNTVVNGSLVTWFAASVPIYLCSLLLSKILIDESITDEIVNVMLTRDASQSADALDRAHEVRPVSGLLEPGSSRTCIAPPIVIWDDINHDRSYFYTEVDNEISSDTGATTSDEVIRRASEIAVWAEELITEELLLDDRSKSHHHVATHTTMEDHSAGAGADDEEQWLIETTLEMVRIAERAVTDQAAMKAKPTNTARDVASTDSAIQESSEIQTENAAQDVMEKFQTTSNDAGSQNSTAFAGDAGLSPTSSIRRREQMPHTDHRNHLGQTRAGIDGSAENGVVNRPREEALHYLLRHLKGVQEKAQKQ
jgi:uncharacterized protein (TIGR03546 family)